MFESAVVMSRKWDSTEAGQEIGKGIKEKLKNPPKFVLLFSTIHYEKYGGFQKFLDAVNKELPEGTPVVGGTVAGFMNNYGCYTRGASALAVYSDEMDVAVGVGHNTKRNPKKAAEEFASHISALKASKFKNKFMFENSPNGDMPTFPILGQRKTLLYPFNDLLMKLIGTFLTSFQYGVGREEEVLKELSIRFNEFNILSTANFDNYKAKKSYQFYNLNVLKNSVTGVALVTNAKIQLNTTFGLIPTETKLEIDNLHFYRCAFGKIDSGKATPEFLKKLNWSSDYLDETLYSKCTYYPIVHESEEDPKILHAHCLGLVLGDYLCFTYPFESKNLRLYTTSGKRLLDAAKENISNIQNKEKIGAIFGVECAIRLSMLGHGVYKVWTELTRSFGEKPFLLVYGAGEGRYTPTEKSQYFNYAFNTIAFSDVN